MAEHNEIGLLGEQMAQRYLLQSYRIYEVNWHYGHKEIDIIAEDNGTLVIVEVKTRRQDFVERPQDAVSYKKQKMLIEAADAYIQKNGLDMPVQFDVISIVINPRFQKFEHIEDCFYPRVKTYG